MILHSQARLFQPPANLPRYPVPGTVQTRPATVNERRVTTCSEAASMCTTRFRTPNLVDGATASERGCVRMTAPQAAPRPVPPSMSRGRVPPNPTP